MTTPNFVARLMLRPVTERNGYALSIQTGKGPVKNPTESEMRSNWTSVQVLWQKR